MEAHRPDRLPLLYPGDQLEAAKAEGHPGLGAGGRRRRMEQRALGKQPSAGTGSRARAMPGKPVLTTIEADLVNVGARASPRYPGKREGFGRPQILANRESFVCSREASCIFTRDR